MNLEVSGRLTYADYFRVTFHSERYLLVIEILATILLVYLILPAEMSIFVKVLLYLLAAIAITLIISIIFYIRAKLKYANADKNCHEKIVKIIEQGIEYGTKENHIFFRWEDIRKGVLLKKYILLYISSKQVLIIPKDFFRPRRKKKNGLILSNFIYFKYNGESR